MRAIASLLMAGLLLIGGMAAANAQGGQLSGVWQGEYWGGDNNATRFQATLSFAGTSVVGSIVEPNGFGTPDARFLLAVVAGQVSGNSIRFLKTYDGTGGQSHSVTYEGRFVSERRIVGTWSIGALSGFFEMAR